MADSVPFPAYRTVSLGLALLFTLVGCLFLIIPTGVVGFFNRFSPILGLPEAPLPEAGLYLGLAVAYMYLVTLLALAMHRHPESRIYPRLLVNGKAASALLSLLLALLHRPYLILLANAAADGAIALLVGAMSRRRSEP